MFWLLALVSVALTISVIAGLPIEDFLPHSLLEQVPVVDLNAGAVGIYVLLGVAASVTPIHRVIHYSATVVHELGHAFTTGLLGARPKQIKIHPSGAGVAAYTAPVLWARWRRAAVTAAGYPAPAIAGLAGVSASQAGLGALWVVFTAAVLMLSVVLIIRNVWGFFWSSSVLTAAYFGVTELSPRHVALIGVGMSGFLLTEAIRDSWEQFRIVRIIDGSGADAEQIAIWYGLRRTWVASAQMFGVISISLYGGWIALGPHWSLVTDEAQSIFQQVSDFVRNL